MITTRTLCAAGLLAASATGSALAAPIVLPAGGGTYTYSTFNSKALDPNAVSDGFAFRAEDMAPGDGLGPTFLTATRYFGGVQSLTYTFTAAPGQTFTSASVNGRVKFYTQDGNLDETVTTNTNPTPVTVASIASAGGGYDPNGPSIEGSINLPVAGASTFDLTYTVQADFYLDAYQLFRQEPDGRFAPFSLTAVSEGAVPEPASLGLLGLVGLGLTRRRRA